MTDKEAFNLLNEMAEESLDPETFEKWEEVKEVLQKTRRALSAAELGKMKGEKEL